MKVDPWRITVDSGGNFSALERMLLRAVLDDDALGWMWSVGVLNGNGTAACGGKFFPTTVNMPAELAGRLVA